MSKKSDDILIVGAARTATGRFNGGLLSKSATDLGGIAVQTAVSRSGIDPATVYEVIMGQVVSAGSGLAPARQAALGAGLPDSIGASSVNKACGSSLKAVMHAANGIKGGEANVFVAGGMESMSNAPYLLPKARQGLRYGHAELKDALLNDGLWCAFENWAMGNAAEFIGRQFEVTREEMDEFALRSHQLAAEATANGRFQAEIVPVEIKSRKGVVVIDKDEPIRANFAHGNYELSTSFEQLRALRPAFEADGNVTAGNAPGLNDGASAVVVTSRAEAERQGVAPLARIVGYCHAGVAPQWIFSAPAKAIPDLLQRVGWTMEDVDLFELNEAFAAQALANGVDMRRQGFDWDWENVNVNGGAIALGHAIGSSGARLFTPCGNGA